MGSFDHFTYGDANLAQRGLRGRIEVVFLYTRPGDYQAKYNVNEI